MPSFFARITALAILCLLANATRAQVAYNFQPVDSELLFDRVGATGTVVLPNVDNTYWGSANIQPENRWSVTNWNVANSSEVEAAHIGSIAATNHLSSDPSQPAVYCSEGLSTRGQGKTPMGFVTVAMTDCQHKGTLGTGLYNNQRFKESYDSLTAYIALCAMDPGSYRAFSMLTTDMEYSPEKGLRRYTDYLEWLKKVLYLNPDTVYYCSDVDEGMMACFGANGNRGIDISGEMAVAKYMIETNRCPLFTNEFEGFILTGRINRYKIWKDSVKVDTNLYPYDSTLPSIDDLGLGILRGKPAAVIVTGSTPSNALGDVTVEQNPFTSSLTVAFDMNKTAMVSFELRDLLGRAIPLDHARMLLEQPGRHSLSFAPNDLASGSYYLRLITDNGEVRTLRVIKQ